MKKVRCIKCFYVDKYGEDGFLEEDQGIEIIQGTIWEVDDNSSRVVGGEVRLTRNHSWVEVSNETFEKYFMKIS